MKKKVLYNQESKSCKVLEGYESFINFKGETGILLIHGFTRSCKHLIELSRYLLEKNISVVAPRLAGHGTTLEDLMETNCYDWLRSAEQGLKTLRKNVKNVYILGDSFGGNLAINLAAKNKISGLILIGAPVRIKREILIKTLLPPVKLVRKYYNKSRLRHDIFGQFTEMGSYSKIPLSNLRQLLKFINEETEKNLRKIHASTLIAQATHDRIVNKKSAKLIYDYLNSDNKEIFLVNTKSHSLLIDNNVKIRIFKKIYEFIQKTN